MTDPVLKGEEPKGEDSCIVYDFHPSVAKCTYYTGKRDLLYLHSIPRSRTEPAYVLPGITLNCLSPYLYIKIKFVEKLENIPYNLIKRIK